MKISKTSWHYQLIYRHYNYCTLDMPANLCDYMKALFWELVVKGLFYLLMGTILLFALMVVAGFVYGWVVIIMNAPELGWGVFDENNFRGLEALPVAISAVLTFVTLLVGLILGIVFVVLYIDSCIGMQRELKKAKEPKEPGIIGQWLKVKKEKVCLIIDYVHD